MSNYLAEQNDLSKQGKQQKLNNALDTIYNYFMMNPQIKVDAFLDQHYNKTTIKPRVQKQPHVALNQAGLKTRAAFRDFYNKYIKADHEKKYRELLEGDIDYEEELTPRHDVQPTVRKEPNTQKQQQSQIPKHPQIQQQQNNFSNKQMAVVEDFGFGNYFENKLREAGQPSLSKTGRYQPIADAKYDQFVPMELTEPETLFNKPGNEWVKNLRDKPRDYRYNIEMMDPKYASWYAAKTGNAAYKGDYNNDGTDDIIVATPKGHVLYYNGFKQVPSSQRIATKYHERYDPDEINPKTGAPVYKNRPPLGQFYNENSRVLETDADGKIVANAEIGPGLKKWSYRDLTVAERFKTLFSKQNYEQALMEILQAMYKGRQINANEFKAAKKACPINTIRSLIMKPLLLILTGYTNLQDANFLSPDDENGINKLVAQVNKNLNKKVNKKNAVNPFDRLKERIANIILQEGAPLLPLIIRELLTGSATNEGIMRNIYTMKLQPISQTHANIAATYNNVVASNQRVRDTYLQAHPRKQPVYYPGGQTRKAARAGGPQPGQEVMELDD